MKARIDNRTVEIPDERMGKAKGGGEGPALEGKTNRHRRSLDTTSCQVRDQEVLKPESVSSPAPSPLPGWPKPTDKWNYSFAQHLELEKQAGRIKYWWYEPWSMWLPGGVRFKPDFLIQYPDGLERRLHVVEIKGGWSRNRRDGVTRYKIAAALFPCFDWSMVKRKGHGWEEYGA